MKNLNLILKSTFAICFIFYSCSNNGNKEGQANESENTSAADTTPVNELASFRFTFTIANLPSPLQVLDEFSKSNLPTDLGLLNPVENAVNYHSSFKQALNYGIYGVDMGYLVVNNRTLESIKYYSTSKKLAEQLNMAETFNRFVNRFENNSNSKDSLLRVIDEAYSATDSYLQSNERLETASEILAGSWIECQHISVNLLKNAERNADNEKLYDRIYEQRLHLDNITKILEEFKNDNDLLKIKKDFENLLLIYKELNDSKDINKDFLMKLSKSLDQVRNNIIS
ncbi:MAG TPA: hypothetical protein VJY62_21425 [Bacteroidia bacterium]|nr:hypothetical protein [Bacteroidia bacterium]